MFKIGSSVSGAENILLTDTRPRPRLPWLWGIAMAAALGACGGDSKSDPVATLSDDEAVAIANETFDCTLRDAAGSGVEVDVRTLPNPPVLRSTDNPIRITLGLDVDQNGWDAAEADPDTWFEDHGIQVNYPTLPEGSQEGIVVSDEFGTIAYVDGKMPGEREFEVVWRLGISASTALNSGATVDVPCGDGRVIVLPGAAQVIEQQPADPDASARLAT